MSLSGAEVIALGILSLLVLVIVRLVQDGEGASSSVTTITAIYKLFIVLHALGEIDQRKIPEINLVFVVVCVYFSSGTSSSHLPKLQ